VNASETSVKYVATFIGDEFHAEWFDLCQWDYRIQSVDSVSTTSLQLTFGRLVDSTESVCSGRPSRNLPIHHGSRRPAQSVSLPEHHWFRR
jgi:hypothetical protein